LLVNSNSAGISDSFSFALPFSAAAGTYSFDALGVCLFGGAPMASVDGGADVAPEDGGGGASPACTPIDGTITIEANDVSGCEDGAEIGGASTSVCALKFAATLTVSATPGAAGNVAGTFGVSYAQSVGEQPCSY
jgi:hypothetical protein